MATNAIGVIGQQGQQNPSGYDALSEVDLSDFIKLLIAELSHQDPLNPMENSEILQQMTQIREIESNTRLTETLESVKLGQNVSTAAGLIGQKIVALTDDAQRVIGNVDRVSIEFGVPKLHVGDQVVDIRNVAGILGPDAEIDEGNVSEDETTQDETAEAGNA